jgi:hypothetical protein
VRRWWELVWKSMSLLFHLVFSTGTWLFAQRSFDFVPAYEAGIPLARHGTLPNCLTIPQTLNPLAMRNPIKSQRDERGFQKRNKELISELPRTPTILAVTPRNAIEMPALIAPISPVCCGRQRPDRTFFTNRTFVFGGEKDFEQPQRDGNFQQYFQGK